jgi:hypothetical protein
MVRETEAALQGAGPAAGLATWLVWDDVNKEAIMQRLGECGTGGFESLQSAREEAYRERRNGL